MDQKARRRLPLSPRPRLRPETTDYLAELDHQVNALDPRLDWRFRPIGAGTLVYLMQVLLEGGPLPTDPGDLVRLDVVLRVLEERNRPLGEALRSRVLERGVRFEDEP